MSTDARAATPSRFPKAEVDTSVVLCTRNGERWLDQLLDSIAGQQLLPDELIVQDDCSTDGSCDQIRRFARTAPFDVRLEINERRLGSTANFAEALTRTRGRFIALADQDDIWYPQKLRRLIGELQLDPTVTMVFSDADLVDPEGRPIGRLLWDTRLIGRTLRRRAVVPEHMFARRALTTGCTMAIRRRVVAASLPFPPELADESAPMRHDRWLSLVAAAVGTVRALPEPLLGFRVHPDQETGVLINGQLPRALGRAAAGALVGPLDGSHHSHLTRAVQLDAAAARAEDLGNFEEAQVLRVIAGHHRSRVNRAGSLPVRINEVIDGVRAGAYGWDPLGLGAVAGDVARAIRPDRKVRS